MVNLNNILNKIIHRNSIFNWFFSLIILFPVIFSFVFRLFSFSIPSYLFIITILVTLLFFISNNLLIISKSNLKLAFYAFFIWIFYSLSFTPSVFASKQKAIEILYNTIFPVILIELFFLSSKSKKIDFKSLESHLLKVSYFLLWFVFFSYLLFRKADIGGRYTLPGVDNVIWFSRFVGMLLIIILCCDKLKKSNYILYFWSIIIAVFMMFGSGSRGAILSVLIVYLIKQSYIMSKKKLFLLMVGIGLLIISGFYFLGGYVFETNFYSLYARLDLFEFFFDYDFQFLKGTGIGSYSLSFFGEDVVYYPHNIFLELFFENGLIGVFLFCLILYFFLKSFKYNIVYFLVVFYFIASLASGDIPGNNNLFILLFVSAYANQSILNTDSNTICYD